MLKYNILYPSILKAKYLKTEHYLLFQATFDRLLGYDKSYSDLNNGLCANYCLVLVMFYAVNKKDFVINHIFFFLFDRRTKYLS